MKTWRMRPKKKIGIVGFGYVGKAMRHFFEGHYEVCIYDLNPQSGDTSSTFATKEEINRCDLGVVCVPTPALSSGKCDLSAVKQTMEWLDTPLILLKSTVPVGTTDKLRKELGKKIVFSPEYCGESSYWTPYAFHTDIKETPFFTFGGEKKDTSEMVDYFLPICGPVKQYRQTSATAAEMAKYMENSFYATKITFCYEFATLCEWLGIDFNEVRELWLLDPRINPMHTAVFHSNEYPFSGKCLPKDLASIIQLSLDSGYDPCLLREVGKSRERLAAIRRQMREFKNQNPQNETKQLGFHKKAA